MSRQRPVGYISSDSAKLPIGRRGTRAVRASLTLMNCERTLDVELDDAGDYRVVVRVTGYTGERMRVLAEIATGSLTSPGAAVATPADLEPAPATA